MSEVLGRSGAQWLQFALVAIFLAYSPAGLAKSTGVDEDKAVQSGACYQALIDRNVSQPTTAPNRELGAACAAENGDIEKAWARVVRLWGSDSTDVPDYGSYARSDNDASTSSIVTGLALLGVGLVYGLLGTPIRSAALLIVGAAPLPSLLGTLASVILRAGLGLVLLWVLGIPYATSICSLAFVVTVAFKLRSPTRPNAAEASDTDAGAAGRVSSFAAEQINDLAGAALGLVGLALLARHHALFLAAAVCLGIVASMPSIIVIRRRFRAKAWVAAVSIGALAVGLFALAQLDPPLAALIGGPGLLSAIFALVAGLAAGAASLPVRGEPANFL